ncbi:MAG: outer membrane protein assembly factor BamE [Gammaproteobacteria bacterium]
MSHAPLAAPASPRPARRTVPRWALLSLLVALPLAGGCVYRMAVQQGNYLDARQVDQVQVGMTRAQVRFLLGTPMLPPGFDDDRWDYLYTLQLRTLKRPERQRLTVFFQDDKVARIENAGAPTEIPAGVTAPDAATAPAAAPAVVPVPSPAPAPDAPPSGLR